MIKNKFVFLSPAFLFYNLIKHTNQSIFLSLLLCFFICFGTSFLHTRPFDELVELLELVDELLGDGLIFFEELTFV